MTKSEIPPRRHTFFSTLFVCSLIIGLFPTQTALAQSEQEAEPPTSGPDAYQLKQWTVEDANAAVAEAKQRWENTEFDYPTPKWFAANGTYLFALERERLARFPDEIDESETYWRLASYQGLGLSSTVPWHASHIDWLVTALETDLNSGTASIETIEKLLKQYGFTVRTKLIAPNLFGDQQNATVIQLEIQDFYTPVFSNQAAIVIRQEASNQYAVVSLYDSWIGRNETSYGSDETITVNDTNGNDKTEIISNVIEYGRYACASNLSVYEWVDTNTDQGFRNLSRDIPTGFIDDYECDNVWSYKPRSEDSIPSLVRTDRVFTGNEDCPDYVVTTYYSWSGTAYIRSNSEISTFKGSEDIACNLGWAITTNGQSEQAVSLLEKALDNGELGRVNWGPATKDYLRFKLGIWYALQGKGDSAITMLQTVRDNPDNPKFKMPSDLARTFLSRYRDTADTFASCKATIQYVRQSFTRTIRGIDVDLAELIKDQWGFSEPSWGYFYGVNADVVCNLEEAFITTVEGLHPTSESEFIELLRQHRIPVNVAKQADLNNDGVLDWIIIANTDLHEDTEIWPVITQASSLTALTSDLYLNTKSYYSTVSQCQINTPETATLFHVGNQWEIFQVKPESNAFYVRNLLGFAQDPATWDASEDERAQALMIAKQCGLPENYFWEKDNQRFNYLSEPILSKNIDIEQVEIDIFENTDPAGTANAIQSILNSNREEPLSIDQRAHLRYLQGLAYELAGHKHDAVNVYWQLWHDYPDSPYAMIIQRKLVLIE